MKRTALTIATAATLMIAFTGQAQANEELAVKSGCTACHKVDTKLVGPAYKEVAAKYKGDKDAVAKLSKKVKEGGSGVWGAVPMPPNAGIKEADIKELVTWILTLKK